MNSLSTASVQSEPPSPIIHIANTDEEIRLCYPVMKELHPHIPQNDYDFVSMIREMKQSNHYHMAYIKEEIIKCCDDNNNRQSIHDQHHDVETTSTLSTNTAVDVSTANVTDTVVVAVIGFRYQYNLSHGKYLYIDDLSTLLLYQGKGYGTILLDYVTTIAATTQDIKMIVLDSGYHRNNAHRLYIKYGFILQAHHFIKRI